MQDYKEMYTLLFLEVVMVIEKMEKYNAKITYEIARIKAAQQMTEDLYIKEEQNKEADTV